jgi:tRNA pseudouridine38-40 synthase
MAMRRVMLTIEYDGSEFYGWQLQARGRTVQGAVEDAVKKATTAFSRVYAASRTDSGVHALGQVAHFETDSHLDDATLRLALNDWLPKDVAVRECRTAPEDFHAQFSPSTKLYRYRILPSDVPRPLREGRVWRLRGPLDADAMHRAAALLVGEHDFTTFCHEKAEVDSKVRRLLRSEVLRVDDELHYMVRGKGFLYNMVRIIAGTLVQVGLGKVSLTEFREALGAHDRATAADTAPAHGLTLVRLDYENDPRGQAASTGAPDEG